MSGNLKYRLHAQTAQYRKRLAQAREIIEQGLSRAARPYVACSFGKDSSVMLHLVIAARPDIPVRFICWRGETDVIDNYAEVVAWWRERGINLELVEMERAALDVSAPERWQTGGRFDGYFIGFRAEESKGRRATLRYNGVVYANAEGMTRIAPLAWWSEMDVGACIAENGLPLLASYGGDLSNRTSARVPRNDYGIRNRMLAGLKHRDPAAFNELARRFPEVREYV